MSNLPSFFNRNSMTSNPVRDLLSIQRRMKEKFATFPRRRLPMLNRRVLTSVVVALGATITTLSFAQHRGTVTPMAGAKAGATQGTFATSDAIPWKPVDPKNHPGLEMFVVGGNPNEGPSLILQKW